MTEVIGTEAGSQTRPIVRVAILADGRIADIALPSELPVRELLPAVRRLLPAGACSADVSVDDAAPRRMTLAPIGGPPFSPDASLDTVGVADGDLLVLQPVPVGPPAPGIVEDVADAAVIFSRSRERPWGITHIRAFTVVAALTLVLAATGVASVYHISTGSATALFALAGTAALAVAGALLLRTRPAEAVASSVIALIPVAAVFGLAVPGELGPAQIVLAAAGVTAWSTICLVVSERGDGIFTAVTVVGAAVLVAAAVAEIWHPPLVALGCGLVAAALLVSVQAAQLSALLARLPLPVIPAPGDPLPPAPAMRVLADLPRRVQVSEAHQAGFIAGAVVLATLGSMAIAGRQEAAGVWGWYAVVAVSVAALLRARVWDNAVCKAWLLAQPFLVSGCLLILLTAQGRYLTATIVLGVFATLTVGFGVVAANPRLSQPDSYSLPMRRLVGLLAAAVDSSLIPVLAYIIGLFAWVLDR